jgi:hypothetical protein
MAKKKTDKNTKPRSPQLRILAALARGGRLRPAEIAKRGTIADTHVTGWTFKASKPKRE